MSERGYKKMKAWKKGDRIMQSIHPYPYRKGTKEDYYGEVIEKNMKRGIVKVRFNRYKGKKPGKIGYLSRDVIKVLDDRSILGRKPGKTKAGVSYRKLPSARAPGTHSFYPSHYSKGELRSITRGGSCEAFDFTVRRLPTTRDMKRAKKELDNRRKRK